MAEQNLKIGQSVEVRMWGKWLPGDVQEVRANSVYVKLRGGSFVDATLKNVRPRQSWPGVPGAS